MKSAFPFIPSGLKTLLVPWVCRLPMKCWIPPLYSQTRSFLEQSQWWDEERIESYHVTKLRAMLRHCSENVPYYKSLFRSVGFDPDSVRHSDDLRRIPTLDKLTLRQNLQQMVATNIPAWRRVYFTTSGTTGSPIKVWNSPEAVWRERAFIDTQWGRIGFQIGDLRAVLRGAALSSGKHWEFDAKERAYTFSNFHMTPENAVAYARVMSTKRIAFLHAYPSSALNFARLLRQAGIATPRFKAVLLGSENVYPGQREQLENDYQCRVYSWYGHTEAVVLAGECERTADYHVFPEYGFLELLRDDGQEAKPGETGEIVGTSLDNFVMPLIRYRTADYAEAIANVCGCGRKHRLIRNVRGRWIGEVLVGKFDNLISITSINFHSDVFVHVFQFQFYQREKGKVQLRLVRDQGYTDADTKQIRNELLRKIGDSMDLEIAFTDAIPVTDRGKFRFVVQELALAAPSVSEVV